MLSRIPVLSQILGLIKSVLDLIPTRKPQALPPVQIININQVVNDGGKQLESQTAIAPKTEILTEPEPLTVVLPSAEISLNDVGHEFMSDDYLLDLAVDLEKKLRPCDRLIFDDKKGRQEQ